MHSLLRYLVVILIPGIMIFTSCQKELSCENCNENKRPVADAGQDQTIVLPMDSMMLNGSASRDPDGKIITYHWVKLSGPVSFNIVHSDSAKTLLKNLLEGVYKFELTVTDNGGLAAKDTLQVTVNNPTQANRPPFANAGPDQEITAPNNTVNLDGGGSTDPDNNITNYNWTKISGPASYNISNLNAVQIHIIDLVPGTYSFELKVTDAGGLVSKDTVQVIVNSIISGCAQLNFFGTLSISREYVCAATAGNKILFAGGTSSVGVTSRVDIYDMVTQSWSTAELSIPRSGCTAVTLGNKIFFSDGSTTSSSRVDVYNASTNTWSTTDLTVGKMGFGAASAGNKVVFAGGYFPYDSEVDVYDDASNKMAASTLAEPRSGISATSLGNKMYFSGGLGPDGVFISKKVNVFDASSNSWSDISMTDPRWGHATIGAANKIFWAGGNSSFNTNGEAISNNTAEIYDVNNRSRTYHTLTQPPYYAGALKNKIIFLPPFAGWSFPIDLYDINNGTWSVCTISNPLWRECGWSKGIVAAGNKIYIVGWQAGVGPSFVNVVWTLDF